MRAVITSFWLLVLLAGCATQAPDAIRDAPPIDLSLAQVRANVPAYVGQRVRWGGRMAAVENRPSETWLDIVALPLDGSGRARASDQSLGRFIARVEGFLDPAIYANGRLMTVAGSVEGTVTRPIGEYPYTYVLVKADAVKLWEPAVERPVYYRDRFYDPFYDPLWPGRVYPW
jgi:outer membrane lipoprotein